MPPAARLGDAHLCPIHGPTPIAVGCLSVVIGGAPAARVLDPCTCAPPDAISAGEASVLIGGLAAARLGDPTAHGGAIVQGCPSVLIGLPPQGRCLAAGAASGAPLLGRF